jgi:predicted transposase/invertase (TIGR01784 family)
MADPPTKSDPESEPDFELSTQPHDAYFKKVFSDPENTAALLRGQLPTGLVKRIDWKSLKLLPASFVKASLRQSHADLLFSARLNGDGREALLYLLCEHQTEVDEAMPLRLLAYLCEVLLEHKRSHGLPLPPVLTFVLHQGPRRWTVSTAFEDLFDLPDDLKADLADYLPKFRHALLDLTQLDPSAEVDDARMRLALNLMKLARAKQLGEEFFDWFVEQTRAAAAVFPEMFLEFSLLYAFHTDTDLDAERVLRKIQGDPASSRTVMTIAEQLIAKGEVRGRQEGRAKGVWIGRIQAIQELMGHPPDGTEALAELEIAELERKCEDLHRDYDTRFKSQ